MASTSREFTPQQKLFIRYLLYYGIFGWIVGIYFGTNAWIFQTETGNFHLKHLLMAVFVLAAFAGEILGGWILDRRTGKFAISLNAALYFLSAFFGFLSVLLSNPYLMYFCAAFFGVGFGVQHSSLDAWFSTSTRLVSLRKPQDSEMGWGYTVYTLGFAVAQTLAFPLMYNFNWEAIIDKTTAVGASLSPAPFVFSLAAAFLVLVSPARLILADPATSPVPEQINNLSKKSDDGYFRIIKEGGIPLLSIITTGACVSFLIIHIDTYAATDLVPGNTVAGKAGGLAIIHFAVFIVVGIFSATLERSKKFRTLSPTARSVFLIGTLFFSLMVLSGAALLVENGKILVAGVLGLAHALLNTLPQIVKWAVLDCTGLANQGKVSTILGVSKRIPNIVLSVVMAVLSLDKLGMHSLYIILIVLNLLALASVIVYFTRIRRYQITVKVRPDTRDEVIDIIQSKVNIEPNISIRVFYEELITDKYDHITFEVFSTRSKRFYVKTIAKMLKKMDGVMDVSAQKTS